MADRHLDDSTRLAVERTRLAYERTLMAWIRTSTSLIAFGFAIFQGFRYLAAETQRSRLISPWIIGMFMVSLGLVALALAWLQHRQAIKALQAQAGTVPYSIAGILAGLIAAMGLTALVVVVLRL